MESLEGTPQLGGEQQQLPEQPLSSSQRRSSGSSRAGRAKETQKSTKSSGRKKSPAKKDPPITGRKSVSKSKHRECAICTEPLPDGHKKKLCSICIQQLIEDETPDLTSTLRDLVRQEVRDSIRSQKTVSKKRKEILSPASDVDSDTGEQLALESEVRDLQKKGVLVKVPTEEQGTGFYSPLFLVKKPDGSYRTIINLKGLNVFLLVPSFKMESVKSAIKLLFHNCFMVVLDLKDAYYHVPIHATHQRFLRVAISLAGTVEHFQYRALPFGVAVAPRVFTKIMVEVMAHLHEQNILIIPYLDDLLIVGRSEVHCKEQLGKVMAALHNLGWIINLKKSRLQPSTSQQFLGLTVDSAQQECRLPDSKVDTIHRLASRAISNPGRHVRILSDNQVTVAYVNHQGGTRSRSLMNVTNHIFQMARKSPALPYGPSYKGKSKYHGRLLKPQRAQTRGLVSKTGCLQSDRAVVGMSRDRSVCQSRKQETPSILFPRPKGQPVRSRRSSDPLEFQSRLRFPSSESHSYGSEENSRRRSPSGFNSPILAQKVLVPMVEKHVHFPTMDPPRNTGPPFPGSSLPSTSNQLAPDSVELERSLLKGKGFSQNLVNTLLKSRKASTTSIYVRVGRKFLSSSGAQIDQKPDIAQILEFLQKGLEWHMSNCGNKSNASAVAAGYVSVFRGVKEEDLEETRLKLCVLLLQTLYQLLKHPLCLKHTWRLTFTYRPPKAKFSQYWERRNYPNKGASASQSGSDKGEVLDSDQDLPNQSKKSSSTTKSTSQAAQASSPKPVDALEEGTEHRNGVFHASYITTNFGETYNFLSHHINSYFANETKMEKNNITQIDQDRTIDLSSDKEKDLAPETEDGSSSAKKSISNFLTNQSSNVHAFVGKGKELESGEATNKREQEISRDKGVDEKAKRLSLQREKIIARVSVDNRTRSLVQSLKRATDRRLCINRVEELNCHLLEFPETRGVAVKEKAIPYLLRLRQAHDETLRAAVREALALIGYNDPVKGRGIRVLTIDGGGTRGIVALQTLRKLEELTGKPVHELFDYICGVSTGAILAFMLGLFHMPLDECEDLYSKLGSDVFKQNVIVGTVKMGWSHAYYNSEMWEKLLKERMGADLMIETSRKPLCPKVSAVSTIVNRGIPLKAFVFRNYNHFPGIKSPYMGGCQYNLWQAIRASSAAPGYFQEYVLGNDLHQVLLTKLEYHQKVNLFQFFNTKNSGTLISKCNAKFTVLVECANDCLLDICQVSSLPHDCGAY
ncbi:unnamed protein product [Ranitomeya imitator]|uniref:ribonuclease H n=1 Tax=Ranitomeya imitator TaxID=111125 RepID=A0ABN9LA07_9NEOB|nr:unnamed protein product [Ranitomeya imitator]